MPFSTIMASLDCGDRPVTVDSHLWDLSYPQLSIRKLKVIHTAPHPGHGSSPERPRKRGIIPAGPAGLLDESLDQCLGGAWSGKDCRPAA